MQRISVVLFSCIYFGCGSTNTDSTDAGTSADAEIQIDAAQIDAEIFVCDPEIFTGEGTENSPYIICDGNHLSLLAQRPQLHSAHFLLDRDIEAPDSPQSIGPEFLGHFRGGGHQISNWGTEETPMNQGLFELVGEGAVIYDLRISGTVHNPASMSSGSGILTGQNAGEIYNVAVSGDIDAARFAGLVVGSNLDTGSISRCSATGSASVSAHGGGVAGGNRGAIGECRSNVRVSGTNRQGGVVGTQFSGSTDLSTATGSVEATGTNAGCLIGSLFGGSIYGSSARCQSVTSTNVAGGLVGGATQADSLIEQSYAFVENLGGATVGGLVGASDVVITIISSYWNSTTSSQSVVGSPLTSIEMTMPASFVDWDFDLTWELDDGVAPKLRWLSESDPGQSPSNL